MPPGVPLDALPAIDFVPRLPRSLRSRGPALAARARRARHAHRRAPGHGRRRARGGGEATSCAGGRTSTIAGVRVHCVPAQHFSGRGLTDRNRRLWAGWVVEGKSRRFYHAGDTGYFGGFTEIGAPAGTAIDLAAIPVGAYRPSAMMRPVHLDPEEAVQAALDLKASRAVAMHFGTFDLTDEPLDEPPARFLAEAARRGLGSRAWVMRVGETRAW